MPDAASELVSLLYHSLVDNAAAACFLETLASVLGTQLEGLRVRLLDHACSSYRVTAESLFVAEEAVEGSADNHSRSKRPHLRLEAVGNVLNADQASSGGPDCRQWRLSWTGESLQVEALLIPAASSFELAAFTARHRPLLDYLMPHFGAALSIFHKQSARAPRLGALRTLHSILPLPLVVVRTLDKSVQPNLQALRLINADRTALSSPTKGTAVPGSTEQGAHLPMNTLSWKAPGFGRGAYEVRMLCGGGLRFGIHEGLLAKSFGLTAAEARLCAWAMQGKNPQQLAEELTLSINTIKARLKSVYRKVGVSSVPQLITRLYFHPAFWIANYGQRAPMSLITASDDS